jgi:hypothetical protein
MIMADAAGRELPLHRSGAQRRRARDLPDQRAEFEAQLDELGRSFEFVSRADLLSAVREGVALPDRACLVTFDDDLLAALESELVREGVDVASVALEQATAMYRYDSPEAASVKYLLNVALGPTRPEPVDQVFAERFSEAELCDRLYATAEQVAELEALGALGAHSHTDRPLGVLEPAEARHDLERGADVLHRISGSRPRLVSYPYGTVGAVGAVSAAVADDAAAAGFEVGMTLERAFNETLDQTLLLARLDTNDAPGGRAPLFSVNGGAIAIREGLTSDRARYLDEETA